MKGGTDFGNQWYVYKDVILECAPVTLERSLEETAVYFSLARNA
jgi:hypothetical protein